MNKTLLVVDDDKMVAYATARIMRSFDWDTMYVTNLATAKEMMGQVDCILTDWEPLGAAVVASAPVPVVVFSGNPDAANRALKGICQVIAKPASPEDLDSALRGALSLKGAA